MADKALNVKVTADTSGYTAELERARTSAQAFQETQKQAAERTKVAQEAIAEAAKNGAETSTRAINQFVQGLARQAEAAGKSRVELLEQRAAQLGVTDSVAAYLAKLKEADVAGRNGFRGVQDGLKKTEISAAQTANAMRMIPAQMTDVVTQLAGGQNPMLIAIQQGGQIKDMFGSIGGAIKGVGTYIAGLMNPLTITAAAVAALGFAFYKASEDAKALNAAFVLTNNYAGFTEASFHAMAESLSRDMRVSIGSVKETMQGLTASGELSAEQIAKVTQAITLQAKLSGEAADAISKNYKGLAEDPARWAEAHNRAHHDMDAATLATIRSMQEAGDVSGAVTVAIDANLSNLANASQTKLGIASRAWSEFKATMSSTWDEVSRTLEGKGPTLAQLQKQRDDAAKSLSGPNTAYVRELDKRIADMKASEEQGRRLAEANRNRLKIQEDAARAEKEVEKLRDQTLTNAQKRQKELEKLERDRATMAKAGRPMDDYDQLKANINEKYKDPKTPGAAKAARDQTNGELAAFKTQIAEIDRARAEDIAQQAHYYQVGKLNTRQYYDAIRDIGLKAYDEEIALQEKRVKLAEQKKVPAAHEAELQKLNALQAKRKEVLTKFADDTENYAKRQADSIRKLTFAQDQVLKDSQRRYSDAQAVALMTKQQGANYLELSQIAYDAERAIAALNEAMKTPGADIENLKEQIAVIERGRDARLAFAREKQDQLAAQANDFGYQANKAIKDVTDTGRTNAQALGDGLRSAFDRGSNALADFAATGKLNFSSLVSSILQDLSRLAMKQGLSMLFGGGSGGGGTASGGFGSLMSSAQSLFGSLGFADGGHVSGPGTSTSDSIPAMLSNGEFVVNASAAGKHRSLLEAINSGQAAHFASGGSVGNAPAPSESSGASGVNVTVNHGNGGGLSEQDAKDLHGMVSAFVDKRMHQRMTQQGGYASQIRYGQL